MNRVLLIIIAVAVNFSIVTTLKAQFRWNGSVEVGLTQNQNLFRSPDRLLNQGQLLDAESLYQNDSVIPLEIHAGIEYRGVTHRIELDYRGSQDRYNTYGNLNGEFHSLRLRETWALDKALDLRLSVEGRKSKKIAANILGDELSRLFEYTGVGSTLEIDWQLSKRYAFNVLYGLSYRDYTESVSAPSLDSHTHRAALEWTYKSKRIRGRYWQVDIGAEYRLKKYRSYLARNEAGQQSATNPINRLHHFSTGMDIRRSLSKKFLIDVEIEGRYRYDFFESYYSFGAVVADIGFEWEPLKRITLEVNVGARRIHYFAKIAPQVGTTEAPLLRYTYLDGEISIEYDIVPWVTIEAFASSLNRYSNATLESRLTRRSYETLEGGAVLSFDLDKAFR